MKRIPLFIGGIVGSNGLGNGLKGIPQHHMTGAAFIPAKANSKTLETEEAFATEESLANRHASARTTARTWAPGDETARLTFPVCTVGPDGIPFAG